MKTDTKVSTTECNLCKKSHTGFRLKIDGKGVKYVICGAGPSAKRVNVEFRNPLSKNPYQPGKWTIDQ